MKHWSNLAELPAQVDTEGMHDVVLHLPYLARARLARLRLSTATVKALQLQTARLQVHRLLLQTAKQLLQASPVKPLMPQRPSGRLQTRTAFMIMQRQLRRRPANGTDVEGRFRRTV